MTKVWFDMDGTIADLYAVEGWLNSLRAFDPKPYAKAQPMLNMSALAAQQFTHGAVTFGEQINILMRHSKSSPFIFWVGTLPPGFVLSIICAHTV